MERTGQIRTVLGSTIWISKVPQPGTDQTARLIGELDFKGSSTAGRSGKETCHRRWVEHGDARITHHQVATTWTGHRQGHTVTSSRGVQMSRTRLVRGSSVAKIPQSRTDDSGGGIGEGDQKIVGTTGWGDIETCGGRQLLHLDA